MTKHSERTLLDKYCKDKLDELNIYNNKGNPEGIKGYPDRIVYGYHIHFIEFKLGKNNNSYYTRTEMQKKWGEQLTQTTSKYYVIESRQEIDNLVKLIYNECVENNIKNFFSFRKEVKCSTE